MTMQDTMTAKDFLVEIGTGELPPKALRTLSEAFAAGIRSGLESVGLRFEAITPFATPRRLAVRVEGLQERQQDKLLEKFGPAVSAAYDKDGNPSPAASGFARSCGVALDQLAQVEKDGVVKLVFRSLSKGSETRLLLAAIVDKALAGLPIPRKIRWGSSRVDFVRPVHWVVMQFVTEVVPANILGHDSCIVPRIHHFIPVQPVHIA